MVIDNSPTVYECGWCKTSKERSSIILSDRVVAQIVSLCKRFENKEWGAVFTVKNGRVEELRIPKQQISGTSVEFLEELGGNGCIHSHNTMNAFWSGTDDATFRDRYEYSIVVNNKMEYKSCHRVKLPCGGFGYRELKVEWGTYNVPEDRFTEPTTNESIVWMSNYKYIHTTPIPTTTPTVSRIPLPEYESGDDDVFDNITPDRKQVENYRDTEAWQLQETVAEAMATLCDNCTTKTCNQCKVQDLVDMLEERIWTDYLF